MTYSFVDRNPPPPFLLECPPTQTNVVVVVCSCPLSHVTSGSANKYTGRGREEHASSSLPLSKATTTFNGIIISLPVHRCRERGAPSELSLLRGSLAGVLNPVPQLVQAVHKRFAVSFSRSLLSTVGYSEWWGHTEAPAAAAEER